MIVYLLRHGIAEDPRPGQADDERALTDEGIERLTQSCKGYRRLVTEPTELHSSPLKRARQTARSLLPNATETKIVVTGNARAWRHFIELRASEGADTEIRVLAIKCLRLLQQEAPNLFGDYRITRKNDGTEVVDTDFRSV